MFARDPAFAVAKTCRGPAPCPALERHLKRLRQAAGGTDESAWKARYVWGSILAMEAQRTQNKVVAGRAVEVFKTLAIQERDRYADDARYAMAKLRWLRGDRARAKETLDYLICVQLVGDMVPPARALLHRWGGKPSCDGKRTAARAPEVPTPNPAALTQAVKPAPRLNLKVKLPAKKAAPKPKETPGLAAAARAATAARERAAKPTSKKPAQAPPAPTPKAAAPRSAAKVADVPNVALEAQPRKVSVRRIRRIVIDPGHGGDDPGALGRGGLKEADLAYDLSVAFAAELRRRGYQVLMTRDRKQGRRLRDRAAYANRQRADLFISVHLNSAKRRAYGFEVYTLDVGGDSYSRRLAARENAQTEEEVDRLRYILADLMTKGNAEDSRLLAKAVAKSVDGFRTNRKKEVRSALFAVLLGARMPAILIEAGFITDNDDVKRLQSDKRRKATAKHLADGIDAFTKALAEQGP